LDAQDDEVAYLCFEQILPQPDSIKATTSGSSANTGLIILGRDDLLRPNILTGLSQADIYLTYEWVKKAGVTNRQELNKFLAERDPNAVEAGKAAIRAYEETGHTDWYEWRLENWGTKWNAYSQSLERESDLSATLRFDTAWSPPQPILEKLAT